MFSGQGWDGLEGTGGGWLGSIWLWLLKEVQDGVENEEEKFGGKQQQVL